MHNQIKFPVSVFVICFNEESNLARCLKSVQFAMEIIVVDSGSTDNTLNVAAQYTDKVFHKEWQGFVKQKAYAFEQCSHEWVLNLDADEELSPALQNRIQQIVSGQEATDTNVNGYEISRIVYFLNKWWSKGGWYPEYRLRLVKRSQTKWGGRDPHEHAITNGPIARIEEPIYHYTYRGFREQIISLNNHSSDAARSLFIQGKTTSLIGILTRPVFRFLKFYLIKRGFLEGIPGLLVAFIESFYAFLKYAKLWELNRGEK